MLTCDNDINNTLNGIHGINGTIYGPSTATIGTSTYEYQDHSEYNMTKELYLINGEKVILDITWASIDKIVERVQKTWKLKTKFPFIEKIERPYISVILENGRKYDIDCNINGFMKLLNKKYTKFAESALLGSLEG